MRPATNVVRLDAVEVLCVRVGDGVACPGTAFRVLEERLPSRKGRRFWGACGGGVYRACVVREASDPADGWGLEAWTIPGGAYLRRRHEGGYDRISASFQDLANGAARDASRPSLEQYRSEDEVILHLPVTDA